MPRQRTIHGEIRTLVACPEVCVRLDCSNVWNNRLSAGWKITLPSVANPGKVGGKSQVKAAYR